MQGDDIHAWLPSGRLVTACASCITHRSGGAKWIWLLCSANAVSRTPTMDGTTHRTCLKVMLLPCPHLLSRACCPLSVASASAVGACRC